MQSEEIVLEKARLRAGLSSEAAGDRRHGLRGSRDRGPGAGVAVAAGAFVVACLQAGLPAAASPPAGPAARAQSDGSAAGVQQTASSPPPAAAARSSLEGGGRAYLVDGTERPLAKGWSLAADGLVLPGRGRVAWTELLALSLAPLAAPARATRVELSDGGRLVGRFTGGDEEGESIRLTSAILGSLEVPLDEVRVLAAPGTRVEALRRALPGDGSAESRDWLLLRGPEGPDPVEGFLDAVLSSGVRFAFGEDEKPELQAWQEVAGLVLPAEARRPGGDLEVVALLRDGTLLRGKPRAAQRGERALVLEHAFLGRLRVPLSGLAALHVHDPATRTWLSDLQPEKAVERGFFAEAGVLFPWRRDRAATGGALQAGGRCWTKGIGAHAASRLTFRVPAGRRRFVAWFAVDDSARGLPVPGNLDAVVLAGDRELARWPACKAGDAPRRIGPLAVEPGALLELRLEMGGDLDLGDRGDWLLAVFLP